MAGQRASSAVQAVFELCKATFTPSGIPALSCSSIDKLRSLLDTVKPTDVGLQAENLEDDSGHGISGFHRLGRMARLAQPITFIDIYECDSFKMCIFCFPTSSVIPLHDHPGMTVFSKLLSGSLYVKAYDWVEPSSTRESPLTGHHQARLAKLAVDEVSTAPCPTAVLHPRSGGNVHCFTAVTPCAVLDILTPPYKDSAGRRCTYYHDYPYSGPSMGDGLEVDEGEAEKHAWLAEMDVPDDLHMRCSSYTGPALIHD